MPFLRCPALVIRGPDYSPGGAIGQRSSGVPDQRNSRGIDILTGILSYCPDSGPSRDVGSAQVGYGAPPVCAGRRVSGAMGGVWNWTTRRHGENFMSS